ncbi:hypothetical protein Selin_1482 [Desulfurispirillum indicum S5]|uniref:DUF2726 domain-containing protein n=1 Tax=Desulfurispirillum indicum (strain ATCC BAA-1389 / DSM 22839 / S5) TaxID=653733 RepID=E6W6X3_DESIS|nr:DUF2726 domain-containing protein [Desulfurispirillum indicum]ADU66216.1 hypothetical protein Selin_1482 [Desulfurispirillum indicum S5]
MRALLIATTLAGIFFISGCGEAPYQNNYKRTSGYSTQQTPTYPKQTSNTPQQQLAIARNGNYFRKNILNNEERKLYWALVHKLKGKKLTIIPQVSLGEVIGSKIDSEFYAINSKRCDFCIVDQDTFLPLFAIEYYGDGRNYGLNSGSNNIRDAIKQTALEIAGVTYIIVRPQDLSDIDSFIDREILGRI